MHPELLPAGMTAFDLERFRKLCSGTSQAGMDQWGEQCSRRNMSSKAEIHHHSSEQKRAPAGEPWSGEPGQPQRPHMRPGQLGSEKEE